MQRLDRGHDPVELFLLAHLRAGAGLHASDVEQIRAVGDQLFGPARERVERPGGAAVVEGVGRAIENAHHDDARPHVERRVTET